MGEKRYRGMVLGCVLPPDSIKGKDIWDVRCTNPSHKANGTEPGQQCVRAWRFKDTEEGARRWGEAYIDAIYRSGKHMMKVCVKEVT